MHAVRPAAVAGMFYTGERDDLAREVSALLEAARVPSAVPSGRPPKALIVPHAGYVYSGPVAATAYALLRPWAGAVRRVVLLGPSHRVYVRGLALPGVDAFSTPLGEVPVDAEAVALALALPGVLTVPTAHAREHSLEVQLPFLQAVLGSFSLVPFSVGEATAREVAGVLSALWGGAETLVVVSSDLSHYLPYGDAKRADARTAQRIVTKEPGLGGYDACGSVAVNGLLVEAERRGASLVSLDLRSSGDTSGDRERVVGYGAFALYEPAQGPEGQGS